MTCCRFLTCCGPCTSENKQLQLNFRTIPQLILCLADFYFRWKYHDFLSIFLGKSTSGDDLSFTSVGEDTGDLKEEMILVCNALRNDLMHANECACCNVESSGTPSVCNMRIQGRKAKGTGKLGNLPGLCSICADIARYVCGSTLRLLGQQP